MSEPRRRRFLGQTLGFFAVLLLLTGGASALGDANARAPDLEFANDVTALALAGNNGQLAVGTIDPGSRSSGGDPNGLGAYEDADVWVLVDQNGKTDVTGRADFIQPPSDCTDRLMDDCQTDVASVALRADGQFGLVAGVFEATPFDDWYGQLFAVDRDKGLVYGQLVDYEPHYIVLSDDGGFAIAAGAIPSPLDDPTGIAVYYEVFSNRLEERARIPLPSPANSLDIAPNGLTGIVGSDKPTRLFAGDTQGDPFSGSSAPPVDVAISGQNPYWAVSGHSNGDVALSRQEVDDAVLVRKPGAPVTAVGITHDGIAYVAGDEKGNLHLYLLQSGTGSAAVLATTQKVGSGPVADVAWSQDGVLLAVAAGKDVAMYYRAGGTLMPLWTDTLASDVISLEMTKDGNTVAVATKDMVRVYEPDMDVRADATIIEVPPGKNVTEDVTYRNVGNRPVQGTVSLGVVPEGWTVALLDTALDMTASGEQGITLRVTGPEHGLPVDNVLQLDHVLRDGSKGFTLVPLSVPTIHDVRMFPLGAQSADVRGGAFATFAVHVRNQGNIVENLATWVEVEPDGWTASADANQLTLAPRTSQNVTIQLTAPADATEGARGDVSFHATGQVPVPFAAVVGARWDFTLAAPSKIWIEPGNLTVFQLRITNTGNVLDSYQIRVNADRIPAGWEAGFGALAVADMRNVGAQSSGEVSFLVKPPEDLPSDGILILPFEATSISDPDIKRSVTVSMRVEGGTDPSPTGNNGSPGLGLLIAPILFVLAWSSTRSRP